jgi:hypothetical protein
MMSWFHSRENSCRPLYLFPRSEIVVVTGDNTVSDQTLGVFAGRRYQRGHGLGSIFGGLFKAAMPLLKKGAKTLGREALKTGLNIDPRATLVCVGGTSNKSSSDFMHLHELGCTSAILIRKCHSMFSVA